MSADSGSTGSCRACGGPLGRSRPGRSAGEWIVVVCFAMLHMGAFIGDGLDGGSCAACRAKTIRWALPLALLLAALMGAGGLLLLRAASGAG